MKSLRIGALGAASVGSSGSEELTRLHLQVLAKASHLKALQGWRICLQALACGCWQEASGPHHVHLSKGLLTTRQLASARERQTDGDRDRA